MNALDVLLDCRSPHAIRQSVIPTIQDYADKIVWKKKREDTVLRTRTYVTSGDGFQRSLVPGRILLSFPLSSGREQCLVIDGVGLRLAVTNAIS